MEYNKNANGQLANKKSEYPDITHKDSDFSTPAQIKKTFPVLTMEMFTGEMDLPINEQASKLQDLINSCKIDLHEKLSEPPVAMQINTEGGPITLFTKGNFSIITGAAKSRKSFLISLLVAAALAGRIQDLLICKGPGVNILFDTEQAKYKVQQIAKRICSLSEEVNPENLYVYSLRTLEPEKRLEVIGHSIATTPNINMVFIDGIVDLEIDPILQAEQAQRIVMKLMQWSEIYNIHIVCVLHYNKTVATLLGHLGSFAHRKADAIIEVSKSKDDETISIVRAVDCREKEFPPFAFSIAADGLPCILPDYTIEKKTDKDSKQKKPAFSFSQVERGIHEEILNSVFKVDKEQGYTSCWRNIKIAIESITGGSIGDNKAKDFLTCYISDTDIIRKEQPKKKPVYVLSW